MKISKSNSLKFLLGSLLFLNTISVFPQAPEAFNFQAIARDASGAIMDNESVSFKAYILEGSGSGTQVYGETHIVTTDQYGHFALAVGQGSTFLGTMSSIDWGSNPYYLSAELNGVDMGSSQLLSVHAKTVGGGSVAMDNDSTNELQTISKVGNTIVLSNGGGSFVDSVNTYTAGTGIDITNNVVSTMGPRIAAAAKVSSSGTALKTFNISSVTKTGVGSYKIYFTNPVDVNSAVMVTSNGGGIRHNASADLQNTTELWVRTGYEQRSDDGSTFDDDDVYRIDFQDNDFSILIYDL